jgi:hypothetical protein
MVGLTLALLLLADTTPSLHLIPPLALGQPSAPPEVPPAVPEAPAGPSALAPVPAGAAPAVPQPDPNRRQYTRQRVGAAIANVGGDLGFGLGSFLCLLAAFVSHESLFLACAGASAVGLVLVPPFLAVESAIGLGAPADYRWRAWGLAQLARVGTLAIVAYTSTGGNLSELLDGGRLLQFLPVALAAELLIVPTVAVATLQSAPETAPAAPPAAAFASPVRDPALAWRR